MQVNSSVNNRYYTPYQTKVGPGVADAESSKDYSKFLNEKINEILAKVQNGNTEPSYQIGAQSFTEKEWKKFINMFDSVEDAIKKMPKEEKRSEIHPIQNEDIAADEAKYNATENKNLNVYYQGKTLEEWSVTDPCYTDAETGIKWYIRDSKHPYMTGEDSAKFYSMCEETGENPLKKFAEMTGIIQQLDDNTVAYIGSNGIAVKGKDGRELFIDTSDMTYEMLMNIFSNLSKTDNYFDEIYWEKEFNK